MSNITNFHDIIGAAQGDRNNMLGKFLYFSLANILVEKDKLPAGYGEGATQVWD